MFSRYLCDKANIFCLMKFLPDASINSLVISDTGWKNLPMCYAQACPFLVSLHQVSQSFSKRVKAILIWNYWNYFKNYYCIDNSENSSTRNFLLMVDHLLTSVSHDKDILMKNSLLEWKIDVVSWFMSLTRIDQFHFVKRFSADHLAECERSQKIFSFLLSLLSPRRNEQDMNC